MTTRTRSRYCWSDYLGDNIVEDLETTPGLPIREPDDDGIIHVQVTSERYR